MSISHPPNPSLTFAIQEGDGTLAMRPHFRLCKGFENDGWEVEVCTIAGPQNAALSALWNRIPVRKIGIGSRQARILALGLYLLKPRRRHVTISFLWDWHNYFLLLSHWLFGSPYAVFLDTFEYQASPDRRTRLKEALRYGPILRNASVILAETPPALERIQQQFPRMTALAAPPCFWRFEMQQVEEIWRAERYFPERKPVILLAGRIIRRKNIHDLLTAFSRLADAYPEWTVDIRGIVQDQGYYDELQAQTVSLKLQERVRFLPPVFGDDLYRLYRETSVFCLPSQGEGMPSVIMEAMYFGGAIVAADAGCMAYQLGYGECGLLHAPGDNDALTHCLEKLISSPTLRISFESKARERMETVFAWETYYPKIQQAFTGLVK